MGDIGEIQTDDNVRLRPHTMPRQIRRLLPLRFPGYVQGQSR
jgi:hypothetical protein